MTPRKGQETIPGSYVSVKLPADLIKRLNAIAQERWVSRSQLIRTAIDNFLDLEDGCAEEAKELDQATTAADTAASAKKKGRAKPA